MSFYVDISEVEFIAGYKKLIHFSQNFLQLEINNDKNGNHGHVNH